MNLGRSILGYGKVGAQLFITFEGLDGCGKTTHAKRLATWLRANGHQVVYTREPGGTKLGSNLRRLLLTSREHSLAPAAEVLLMAADRAQHVQEVIAPSLVNNKIVVCDRFVDSSLAYQGYGLEYPVEAVRTVNEIAADRVTPDLTFFLDVQLETLAARLQQRSTGVDKIEARGLGFHARVREGYLRIIEQDPKRFYCISVSNRSIGSVQAEIRAAVGQRLGSN